MKFFEKLAKNKTWDENISFTENITGGAAIGGLLSGISARSQTNIIKRKLKAIEEIKKIKNNALRMSIIGSLAGAALGYGKHLYEKEQYTK